MSDRTILVTGSARGIGSATAAYLLNQGHKVIGLDLEGATVEADLATQHGRAAALAAIAQASDGRLDAVIACAALAAAPADQVVSVNYFGTIALIGGLRDLLARSDQPRVVAASSAAILNDKSQAIIAACLAGDEDAAKVNAINEPELAYASSKAALSQWIRRTATLTDWAGRGILMNAVALGLVNTRMTQGFRANEEAWAMMLKLMPIAVETIAEPADMAPLLAFLASPENRYMVGQTIFSDGGCEVIRRAQDNM